MASAWFNKGMFEILSGATDLDGAQVLKVLLLQSSYAFDAADNVVNDLTPGTNEVTGGSYARQTLATKTVTEDDAGGRAFFDAADAVFSAVPAQVSTINAAVTYREITNDTDSVVLFYNDFTAINGNGSDITVQWNANGIAEIT